MLDYKKFLIQQYTFDGTSYQDVGDVVDSFTAFGIVCQEFPFKYLPEAKELPKREWYDEHGDDVYVPTDGLKMQAYDMEVKLLYVGNIEDMPSKIKSFVKFIYGHTNIVNGSVVSGASATNNVFLKIYDEYTKIGKRGVYVESVDDDLYMYTDVNIKAISEFKVKFRVTDPVTDITLNNDTPTGGANG